MRHWTYMLLLLACLGASVPLEAVFGLRVLRRPRILAAALLPELVIVLAWDLYAIHQHQWSYDPRRTVGVHLPGGIPLEEVLFFVVVPICAVLTFEAVKRCRAPRAVAAPPQNPASPQDPAPGRHPAHGRGGPA
jgi:lycopene cyclase domain-containing protein